MKNLYISWIRRPQNEPLYKNLTVIYKRFQEAIKNRIPQRGMTLLISPLLYEWIKPNPNFNFITHKMDSILLINNNELGYSAELKFNKRVIK